MDKNTKAALLTMGFIALVVIGVILFSFLAAIIWYHPWLSWVIIGAVTGLFIFYIIRAGIDTGGR